MHAYRTHNCGELRLSDDGQQVRLSGWIHRKRDHGDLMFVDLRDNFGLTQVVADVSSAGFVEIEAASLESVICVTGKVLKRTADTINTSLPTGEVELQIESFEVLSSADTLPMPVNQDAGYPEEIRLRYRFLDLRREELHSNILLRSEVIASIRRRMVESGFTEFQTPILTASSPEGARDYLVPSRIHPGEFYALPQAPQQFKQLLMVAGFDRYFQIAPCFRDEDARADRSPGEFYQLDLEMSFVTEDEVLSTVEPVLAGVFEEFAKGREVTPTPFPRIPYKTSILEYGSDKPDLRNPLKIVDVSDAFRGSDFRIFAQSVEKGSVVRAIPAPGGGAQPRSWFDKLNDWARREGAAGLGYIIFENGGGKGPIARNLDDDRIKQIRETAGLADGDAVFFACDTADDAAALAGRVRTQVGEDLGLIEDGAFRFCWVVDYPMYEMDQDTSRIDFSHNPFSMPQGGLNALNAEDPLEILAHQYDIVCNGIELASGAIRNHLPDIMYRAFDIAGYGKKDVEEQFSGLLNAFKFGAPPHGGIAPGVDRIVMLLADEPNIREVVAFPMNQQAQDLMMGAPAPVESVRLRELHLSVRMPVNKDLGSDPDNKFK